MSCFADANVNIRDLDIPVNAVATALKDFFLKRLPPLFTMEAMEELEDVSGMLVWVLLIAGPFLRWGVSCLTPKHRSFVVVFSSKTLL